MNGKHRTIRRMARRAGFTLIEIMVVVVILGLLAALVVPRIGSQVDEAKRTMVQTQIKKLERALDMYRRNKHEYKNKKNHTKQKT